MHSSAKHDCNGWTLDTICLLKLEKHSSVPRNMRETVRVAINLVKIQILMPISDKTQNERHGLQLCCSNLDGNSTSQNWHGDQLWPVQPGFSTVSGSRTFQCGPWIYFPSAIRPTRFMWYAAITPVQQHAVRAGSLEGGSRSRTTLLSSSQPFSQLSYDSVSQRELRIILTYHLTEVLWGLMSLLWVYVCKALWDSWMKGAIEMQNIMVIRHYYTMHCLSLHKFDYLWLKDWLTAPQTALLLTHEFILIRDQKVIPKLICTTARKAPGRCDYLEKVVM